VSAVLKALVERTEESARWTSQQRAGVTFAPGKTAAVGLWEVDLELDDAPLIKYTRVLRKTREKQRKLVEKVRIRPTFLGDVLLSIPDLLHSRHERAKTKFLKSEHP
jgi:hypothetical protein